MMHSVNNVLSFLLIHFTFSYYLSSSPSSSTFSTRGALSPHALHVFHIFSPDGASSLNPDWSTYVTLEKYTYIHKYVL